MSSSGHYRGFDPAFTRSCGTGFGQDTNVNDSPDDFLGLARNGYYLRANPGLCGFMSADLERFFGGVYSDPPLSLPRKENFS
jgi:hypothetical protein